MPVNFMATLIPCYAAQWYGQSEGPIDYIEKVRHRELLDPHTTEAPTPLSIPVSLCG